MAKTRKPSSSGGTKKKTPAQRTTATKKKSSPKPVDTKGGAGKGSNFLSEAIGLGFVAFAALLVISIYAKVSGNPDLAGKVGKIIASWLFDLFGVGAYLSVLAMILFGVELFFSRRVGGKVSSAIGWMGMLAVFCTLASMFATDAAGGWLGSALAGRTIELLGPWGGAVVVGMLGVLFLGLVSGLSGIRVFVSVVRWSAMGGRRLVVLLWKVLLWVGSAFVSSLKGSAETSDEYYDEEDEDALYDEEPMADSAEGSSKLGDKKKKVKLKRKGKSKQEVPIIESAKEHEQKKSKRTKERSNADTPAVSEELSDTQIEPIPISSTTKRASKKEQVEPKNSLGVADMVGADDEDWLRKQEEEALERVAAELTAEIAAEEAVTVDESPEPDAHSHAQVEPPSSKPSTPKPKRAGYSAKVGEPVITEHKIDKFDPNKAAGPLVSEDEPKEEKPYELPSLDMLEYVPQTEPTHSPEELKQNAKQLEETLADYGIKGHITEIHPGPLITMYEFKPQRGIKISKIAALQDDLAMALEAYSVRIIAPIPGKSVVGIEVPNRKRQTVYIKEILAHPVFRESDGILTLAMGKDIFGYPVVANLEKMPHLLIAGTTGSGKSVSVNAMIISLLYRMRPDELKLLLVDPKRLEFSFYEDIPHLLLPVVIDPKKAVAALRWTVAEMERRYQLMKDFGVKNIGSFNRKVEKLRKEAELNRASEKIIVEIEDEENEANPKPAIEPADTSKIPDKLPFIVVIIDELADLMMVVGKDAEIAIARLAQLARAAGIHLIIATQRPSTDVITGLIKNNFPCRVSFKVGDKVSSRVVLDTNGAEALLGVCDMLFMSPSVRGGIQRLHAPFISEEEIHRVVDFIKSQGEPEYAIDLDALTIEADESEYMQDPDDEPYDELFDTAVQIVCETKQASASYLQRRLKIGYNRAARLIERMEKDGIVGPPEGSKPRKVYGRPISSDGIVGE